MVRKTESRLPDGFTAQDLGQVHDGYKSTDSFVLISYLTSPIAKGASLDYVVFALKGAQADKYLWTFQVESPSGVEQVDSYQTEIGIQNYKVEKYGKLKVFVTVLLGDSTVKNLLITQIITSSNSIIEDLIRQDAFEQKMGALSGNPQISKEVIDDFHDYIFRAAYKTEPNGIPSLFLAAFIYNAIQLIPTEQDETESSSRAKQIKLAASALNTLDSVESFQLQIDNRLGVCQLEPQTVLMLLDNNWLYKSQKGGRDVDATKLKNYEESNDDKKLDIFNLLRFPKSNILMCAKLLRQFKQNRFAALTTGDFLKDENALRIICSEYFWGPTNTPNKDYSMASFSNGIINLMSLPTLTLVMPDNYGGYDLRRADNDAAHTYSGIQRTQGDDVLPGTGEAGFVTQLQRDLSELGFLVVGTPDGDLGRCTEWAVREFQIYSKMNNCARQEQGTFASYVDSLQRVTNNLRYNGPISGVLNFSTRGLIQFWKKYHWRCPVIVGAYDNQAGTIPSDNLENVWQSNEVPSNRYVYVRDFSRYYIIPSSRNADDKIIVGRYTTADGYPGGPISQPSDHTTWSESELLPEALIGSSPGKKFGTLTDKEFSTYKVVRAVSRVECNEYFDSINAWDNTVISVGPCHWTLFLEKSPSGKGELEAYLAYLRHTAPDAFNSAIKFFGISPHEDWINESGIPNGERLFDRRARKYLGVIALQQEDNYFYAYRNDNAAQAVLDCEYFRTWHWFYRFVMAGRTIDGYRRRMWDMVRIRLRDILSTPWGEGVPNIQIGTDESRPAKISDVYTSEKAVAFILRWHVFLPGNIISNDTAGNELRSAFDRANIPVSAGDPTQWNDTHESNLIQGIIQEVQHRYNDNPTPANKSLRDTITSVNQWGCTVQSDISAYLSLDESRNSFRFFIDDIRESIPTPSDT